MLVFQGKSLNTFIVILYQGGFHALMESVDDLYFGFSKVFVLEENSEKVRYLCTELVGNCNRIVDIYKATAIIPITNW